MSRKYDRQNKIRQAVNDYVTSKYFWDSVFKPKPKWLPKFIWDRLFKIIVKTK